MLGKCYGKKEKERKVGRLRNVCDDAVNSMVRVFRK